LTTTVRAYDHHAPDGSRDLDFDVSAAQPTLADVFVRDFSVERPFGELGLRFAAGVDRDRHDGCCSRASRTDHRGARWCRCGPARVRPDRIVLPLQSIGAGAIPDLDGDVRVTPLGSERTHVALEGVWQRAGSDVVADGHAVDALARAFLHRLAADAETDLSER
jgi:hypothetical protein